MEIKRTPEERFENLPDYPFVPHYLDIEGIRMHYVREGSNAEEVVLMLHGEPSWSFLYRKMIPIITRAGIEAIAPDLIGFGKSDKPVDKGAYTYQNHVDWITGLIEKLDLKNITLVCQDWGGLIGLRVAAENPDRFKRIVAANTFLPTGDRSLGKAFMAWRKMSQALPKFPVKQALKMGTETKLPKEVIQAYLAPFPDESYKTGARVFPMIVPISPDDPATVPNRAAWEVLKKWEKPFLTAFSDGDPITRGMDRVFHKLVPGTKGMPHTTIVGGGHFLQEDKGEELARVVVEFMQAY